MPGEQDYGILVSLHCTAQLASRMIEDGITNFIEIGPGTALSSMAKRMGKNLNTLNIQNIEDIKKIK